MIAKPRQYIFVILLAIAGILIISSSAYSIKVMHDVADIHTPLVDAAMEIKFELAMTHLQLEEHIAGDKTISTDEVILHLKQAKWYARAMLSGGQNAEGLLIPLEDNALRRKITTVVERITQIDGLVQARLSDIKLVQPGSKIDQQLDRLFEDTLKEADSVEDALLAILVKEQSMQKTINYSALMLSIMLFAIVIGFVIFNRRFELKHINQLYELANLDELTGINNRRSFNSILSDEWNRALRAQYSLTLVICDIDFFKNYNDAIGHQAGDECLRAVVEVMQSILQRPVDSVARYGGEEFAFILPFTDKQGAINIINKLHGKLKMKKILHPNSEISDYVTLSAGVASLTPGSKHSIEELISVADKSLYRAKAEGRNRTCYKVLS